MLVHNRILTILVFSFALLFSVLTRADVAHSLTGAGGYDLVSYHQQSGPLRGDGSFVSTYDGVDYLFASEENKQTFETDPEQYLPAYGGYCAYGVSVGKKFHVDPLAWKIVDDKLYLNLNKKVQTIWLKDIEGNISKADTQWQQIKSTPAAQL